MTFRELQVQNWLMNLLQIGPGMGEVHYLVKSASAYYAWMRDELKINPALIHYTLREAEASLTSGRNDVILVAPGAYDAEEELAWDKTNCHIVGMSGENTMGDYYEPGVVLYSDETDTAHTINVTGPNTQFHNVAIQNAGNNAACRSPLYVNKYAGLFKNVSLMGNMMANQNTQVECASLYIGVGGHTPKFIDCVIGQDVWGTRSVANSGQVNIQGNQMNDGIFQNCIFKSFSNTATVAMFRKNGTNGLGRGWLFDNCKFYNFTSDATEMNQVFYGSAASSYAWTVMMHNCGAYGYSRWTDQSAYKFHGTMAVADDGGGLGISLDHTVGGST